VRHVDEPFGLSSGRKLMSSRSEPNGLQVERLARELTQQVYHLTKKPGFAKDYGLKGQIQDAAGSSMHNIAEGFDSETNAEFIRFLRYAKRSCTEVQTCPPPARSCLAMAGGSLSLRRGGRGELYVSLDEKYISPKEFKDVYEQARRIPQKRDCCSWVHQLFVRPRGSRQAQKI